MFDYTEAYLISITKYRFVIYCTKTTRFGNLHSENNVGKYTKPNIIIRFKSLPCTVFITRVDNSIGFFQVGIKVILSSLFNADLLFLII